MSLSKIDNMGCPHGCNSLGLILMNGEFVPCPIHGKKSDILLEDGKLPNGDNLFDLLHIPLEYRGKWVTDISRLFLNEDISKNCVKDSITQMKYMMETLFNVISIENNIYMESLYFYANPKLLDLYSFMYTLQRIAFENNISVLPAISINDLAGLAALQDYSTLGVYKESDIDYITKQNRLAGQGADWFYRTKTTYTDYLRCSLCFVMDTKSSLNNNLEIFSGFLEERGNRGLPTYVFSTTYFDMKRENLFYDKSHSKVLSCLTPYILLAKSQEVYAREKGWLKNVKESPSQVPKGTVQGFSLSDFGNKDNLSFDL